jgi:hypothetical protein
MRTALSFWLMCASQSLPVLASRLCWSTAASSWILGSPAHMPGGHAWRASTELPANCRGFEYVLTYMAWVQSKHPAVGWLGASTAHGGKSPANLGNTERKRENAYPGRVEQYPNQPPTFPTLNTKSPSELFSSDSNLLETTLECVLPAPGGPFVQGPPSMHGGDLPA